MATLVPIMGERPRPGTEALVAVLACRAKNSHAAAPRTWTEGAVIRGAPVCSGGGRSGVDGERNNVQGADGI